MREQPTLLTDQDAERRIQDAAMVLLDLCGAQIKPYEGADSKLAASSHMSGSISLAVQAVFLNEKLRPDMTYEQRMKGECELTRTELMGRGYGLGMAVGHCLGLLTHPIGSAQLIQAYTAGLLQGMNDRKETIRKSGFKG